MRIELLEHNSMLSDHKPIRITMNHQNIKGTMYNRRETTLNKQWLKQTTIEFMQNLVDADNLADILAAFEIRISKGKQRNPIKPNICNRIIEKLDKEMDEWTSEATINAKRKFANEYYGTNIHDPEIHKDPKNWHKSL